MSDPKVSKSQNPWLPVKQTPAKPVSPAASPHEVSQPTVFGQSFTLNSLIKSNSSLGSATPQISLPETPVPKEVSHTVKSGESLSSIAQKYLGDGNAYMEIFALNQSKALPHPNSPLKAGMVLKINVPAEIPSAAVSHNGSSIMWSYQQKNPMSYISFESETSNDAQNTLGELTTQQPSWFVPTASNTNPQSPNDKGVTHIDAVKINKRFDLLPALTAKTLPTQFANWATKAAEVLEEHQASVLLGQIKDPNGQMVNYQLDGAALRQWADKFKANSKTAYPEFKAFLKNELGLGALNTLWAIDDIVNNVKYDPYFTDAKHIPKQLDLAAVKDDFKLTKDTLNYTSNLLYHHHRGVPVHFQGSAIAAAQSTTQAPSQVLQDLTQYFTKQGTLKDPIGFEKAVYGHLNNPNTRRDLLEHFQLNSQENVNALIPAITSEGGVAPSQRVYNSYFAVGSVMLNRALGRNLKKSAQSLAQGIPADKIKPVKMKEIIFEKGQFEIAWRKLPGATSTIYETAVSHHKAYQQGKLQEDGNSSQALTMAYETVADMMKGINCLQAEVNGALEKGAGRSTADLFYFNQSRSKDYSSKANQGSAVAMIDENNTHVFFKAWDEVAYFR